jgi:hypothetical protein
MAITEPVQRTRAPRSRRRLWVTLSAIGAVALVIVIVVLVVFQPQKLFIDDEVNETIPVAAGPPGPSDSTPTPTPAPEVPAGPTTLLNGSFISRDHGTRGAASVLDVGGTRYLRIEDLDTDNGPSLYVYLSTNTANGPEEAFDDDIVDLGSLKGNVGNQNYELPADVDLTRYASVVIWCDRFDAAFGAADLA